MTPLTKAPGAQFEISIDGKPRSYRDRKAVAIEPAEATHEAWAAKLRARNIGDFRHWKDHEKYMKSLERVLRDLSVSVP